MIRQLYDGFTFCQVIHGGSLTDPFPVSTGVRQGCLLSPLLFLMVIDWVSRTACDKPSGIKWTLQSCLEDLDFADDICQLSHRHQDSQKQASNLETTAKNVGLYINPSKTKSMRINANNNTKTKIRGAEIDDVTQFTYLGSVISTSGGTDEDIQARKKKAQQAFAILKPIWRSKALRTATKIRIFNSNVKSILLYGSETWRITAASTKTVQVFLNRCLIETSLE